MTFMQAMELLGAGLVEKVERRDWYPKSPIYFDWADILTMEDNPHEGAMLNSEDIFATDWKIAEDDDSSEEEVV